MCLPCMFTCSHTFQRRRTHNHLYIDAYTYRHALYLCQYAYIHTCFPGAANKIHLLGFGKDRLLQTKHFAHPCASFTSVSRSASRLASRPASCSATCPASCPAPRLAPPVRHLKRSAHSSITDQRCGGCVVL